jgi:hypothetical protein
MERSGRGVWIASTPEDPEVHVGGNGVKKSKVR